MPLSLRRCRGILKNLNQQKSISPNKLANITTGRSSLPEKSHLIESLLQVNMFYFDYSAIL